MKLHSDSAFDYLATPRGLGQRDSLRHGPSVFRVVTNRMLVRVVEGTRGDLAAERQREGLDSEGYRRFVSSTYLVDVSCGSRLVATVEAADFDDEGRVLSRRLHADPEFGRSVDGWSDRATERLVAWVCTREQGGLEDRPPDGV